MDIHLPLIITPRLLPGAKVGDGFISITYARRGTSDGRTRYLWHIDIPAGEFNGDDLKSGCQGGDLQNGLKALLSLLSAAAESYRYREATGREGENIDLFPPEVVVWAAQSPGAVHDH